MLKILRSPPYLAFTTTIFVRALLSLSFQPMSTAAAYGLSNQILFFTRYLWTGSKCRQAGSLRSRALEFDFSCHDFLKNWTLRNTRLSEPVTDKDM